MYENRSLFLMILLKREGKSGWSTISELIKYLLFTRLYKIAMLELCHQALQNSAK